MKTQNSCQVQKSLDRDRKLVRYKSCVQNQIKQCVASFGIWLKKMRNCAEFKSRNKGYGDIPVLKLRVINIKDNVAHLGFGQSCQHLTNISGP